MQAKHRRTLKRIPTQKDKIEEEILSEKQKLQKHLSERTSHKSPNKQLLGTDFSHKGSSTPQLVFITGTPRSGTGLLQGMMSSNPQTHRLTPECVPLELLLAAYKSNMRMGHHSFQDFLQDRENASLVYQSAIFRVLDTLISSLGHTPQNLILKRPELSFALDVLSDIFGDNFKVVYMLRHPYSVVSSLLKVSQKARYVPQNTAHIAESVYRYIRAVELSALYKQDNFHLVRYKDLVLGKEESIIRLEAFLGFAVNRQGFAEGSDQALNKDSPFCSEGYGKAVDPSFLHKYKEVLDERDLEIIDAFFADFVARHNLRLDA